MQIIEKEDQIEGEKDKNVQLQDKADGNTNEIEILREQVKQLIEEKDQLL